MSVSWDLKFNSPLQVAGNVLGLGIGLVALAIFIRRLASRDGVRWRDLLLLPNFTFDGVTIPVFIAIWLIAEWD